MKIINYIYAKIVCKSDEIEIIQLKEEYFKKIGNTLKSNLIGYTSLIIVTFGITRIFTSQFFLAILSFSIFGVLFYINTKVIENDFFRFAEIDGATHCRYSLPVSESGNSNEDGDYDPIINYGLFYIPDRFAFKYIISNMSIEGLKLDSTRYLTDKDKDFFNKRQPYYLPVLISKSWKLYPLGDYVSYLEYSSDEGRDYATLNRFNKSSSLYDAMPIKDYFDLDYSDDLKYDLYTNYGHISFSDIPPRHGFVRKVKETDA